MNAALRRFWPALLLLGALALVLLASIGDRGGGEGEALRRAEAEAPAPAPAPGRAAEPAELSASDGPAAPSRAPSRNDRALLVVRDASGGAVPGAGVALLSENGLVTSGRTDDQGRFAFWRDDAARSVLVSAPGRALHEEARKPSAAEQLVVLPDGAALAGHVEVDGEPADETIELIVESDRPWLGRELPAPALEALGLAENASTRRTVTTGPGGRFRLRGLAADWSGQIHMPQAYSLLEGSKLKWGFPRFYVAEPREDLVIPLVRNPELKGRVLRPDGSLVAEVFAGNAHVVYADGDSTSFGLKSDEHGRFARPVEPKHIVSVKIRVHADGGGSKEYAWSEEELPANLDFGDLYTAPTREVVYRVVGPSGEPVAGARARGPGSAIPTDESGAGRILSAPVGAFAIKVAAEGYAPAEAEVPETCPEGVTVYLTPSNRLEVRILGEAEFEELRVEVNCAPPLLDDPWGGRSHALHLFAGRFELSVGNDESVRYRIVPDDTGRVVLGAVTPGNELTVGVRSPTDSVVAGPETVVLEAAENRVLELPLAAGLRSFRGRVLDSAGRPLAAVMVRRRTRSFTPGIGTDAEGVFELEGLQENAVSFNLIKPGFAPLRVEEHPVPPEDETAEFRMVPGRVLLAHFVGPDGVPVAVSSVFRWIASPDEHESWGLVERVSENTFRLFDLPAGPVQLRVLSGGRAFDREADARHEEVWVTLPSAGRLRVRLPRDFVADPEKEYRLVLHPQGEDQHFFRDADLAALTSTGQVVGPVYAPSCAASLEQRVMAEFDGQTRRRWEIVTKQAAWADVAPGRTTEVVLAR